jgi:hypothetical protein
MTPSRPGPNATHRQWLAVNACAPVLVALCLTFGAARSSAAPRSPQEQVRVAWARLKDAFVHRSPSGVCGMLTLSGRRDFVAGIDGLRSSKSCKAVAAGLVKSRGLASEAAHARLLSVDVRANTAATRDTTGVFMAHWVRTGKSMWKVSEPPPGDVLPFADKARDRQRGRRTGTAARRCKRRDRSSRSNFAGHRDRRAGSMIASQPNSSAPAASALV